MAHPYGWEHKRRRDALLPLAYGKPCPGTCGRVMTKDMRLELDHTVPLALGGQVGDRIMCARCNRSRGATMGNLMRQGKLNSREW